VHALVKGVWAEPKLLDMGNLCSGAPYKAEFCIFAAGYPEVKVKSVHVADGRVVKVTQREAQTGKRTMARDIAAVAVLEVESAGTGVPPGRIASEISVAMDTTPEKVIRVPIIGHVLGAVTVVPSPLVLGLLIPGKPVQRTCVVSFNDTGLTLDRLKLSAEHDFVDAVLKPADGGERSKCVLLVTGRRPIRTTSQFIRGAIGGKDRRTGAIVLSVPYVAHVSE
jgi:hypothetical protein